MTFSCTKCVSIVTGILGLRMQTLTKQDWKEVSWRNNAYNIKFSVKALLDQAYPTADKAFNLHVVKQCKLTLFSWGNIDYTTRISGNLRIKHVFSMNFTHFYESFLHQGCIHCNRPNWPKYANTDKARLDRGFMAKQCLYC